MIEIWTSKMLLVRVQEIRNMLLGTKGQKILASGINFLITISIDLNAWSQDCKSTVSWRLNIYKKKIKQL